MYKSSYFKLALPALAAMLFVSCDKDFNEIGADIIGDDHFDFMLETSEIIANTIPTGAVQSNNLPINPLGVYNNEAFGVTKAHFVTQVELKNTNPTIGTNISDVSVKLKVPYFSHIESNNSDGSRTYELDSLIGTPNGQIDLAIYRSGFFLGDIGHEGDEQVTQKYYSDQNADFDNLKVGSKLNNGLTSQNTDFTFSPNEYTDTVTDASGNTSTVKVAPQMRLDLDAAYFQQHILEAGSANLQSNNAFKNYFRGLYFQVNNSGSAGTIAMMDFSKGTIEITYNADITSTNSQTGEQVVTNMERTIVLTMTGNTVSLLEHVPSNIEPYNYSAALAQAISPQGQARIYLKGGAGSVAKLDIFGTEDLDANGTPDQIDAIRENGWLINEASLTFTVDQTKMGPVAVEEPRRLYLYDINNKIPTLDYLFDNTTNADRKENKGVYGGIALLDANKRVVKYKVRVTNYVRSLIADDSTYVSLGLAVTEDINLSSMAKLRTPNEYLNDYIPTASVMNPLGVVLYGNNIPATDPDWSKRMRLEIYYTKPN